MNNMNIKKPYLWPFNMQLLVFCLLAVIFFYFGYQFILAPLSLDLNNARGHEHSLKSDIEVLIHHEASLNHYIARLPDLKRQLESLKKTMILHSESPALLKEVLTNGNKNHLYFSLFDPSEGATDRGYDKITIKIIAIGSYHQLADFLSEIANMHRIIVINQFTIAKEATSNQPPATKATELAQAANRLTAEFSLDVYVMPEAKS